MKKEITLNGKIQNKAGNQPSQLARKIAGTRLSAATNLKLYFISNNFFVTETPSFSPCIATFLGHISLIDNIVGFRFSARPPLKNRGGSLPPLWLPPIIISRYGSPHRNGFIFIRTRQSLSFVRTYYPLPKPAPDFAENAGYLPYTARGHIR